MTEALRASILFVVDLKMRGIFEATDVPEENYDRQGRNEPC